MSVMSLSGCISCIVDNENQSIIYHFSPFTLLDYGKFKNENDQNWYGRTRDNVFLIPHSYFF